MVKGLWGTPWARNCLQLRATRRGARIERANRAQFQEETRARNAGEFARKNS
jgi:hypothetical protein